MASVVLDLELEGLPGSLDALEGYDQALALFRLKGVPVGQAWLAITGGRVSEDELEGNLKRVLGEAFWRCWLAEFLGMDDERSNIDSPPTMTIAICTRDRPNDLKRCLDKLLEFYEDGQEILVIDNCPSSEVTRRLVEKYPLARYVLEDRPGLDVARNRALREASHEVVAFIDDDALPDRGWTQALSHNFGDPLVLCVTGLTMPIELQTEAQEWFERYNTFSRGFKRTIYDSVWFNPLQAGKVGAGVNMALRRSVLDLVGPFDEALDAGTPTQSGGDTEMFSRILRAGYRIVYDPAAVNWHRHRRSWEELRRTVFGYGAGVYAAWTRQLLYDRELGVLRSAWSWFWGYQLPGLIRSWLKRPGAMPADLLLAELRGCLYGPKAYLVSRRELTKQELPFYERARTDHQPDYPHP